MTEHDDRPDAAEAPPRSDAASGPGVTLVLGGGGFKGMAHVGIMLALEEEGIPVERIVGTSAGALMGGAYAYHGSAEVLKDAVCEFVHSDAFQRKGFVGFGGNAVGAGLASFMNKIVTGLKRQVALERMFRRSSAFGGAALRFVVHSLLPDVAIEELGIPLAVLALDVEKGQEVVLQEGSLLTAVTASSSVPGFFPPVERDGRVLVDAGLVDNLPTRAARSLGATRLVAVDLSAGLLEEPGTPSVGMDVLLRTQDIATWYTNRRLGDLADVVITPELTGRGWLDPSDPTEAIETGRQCAHACMDRIRELLRSSTWSG